MTTKPEEDLEKIFTRATELSKPLEEADEDEAGRILLIPTEGVQAYDELVGLRAAALEKKEMAQQELRSVKGLEEKVQALASEMSAAQADQEAELAKLKEEQENERAATDRVLANMHASKRETEEQIDEKKKSIAALESTNDELLQEAEAIKEKMKERQAEEEKEREATSSSDKVAADAAASEIEALRIATADSEAAREAAREELVAATSAKDTAEAEAAESANRVAQLEQNLKTKEDAMANTTAQLDVLDASAAAMKTATQANVHRAFSLEATTAKLRQESRDMEASIEATLAAQSRVEAAVTAMVRRAEYLESKVKAMDEEKERIDKKIEAFEQGASRAVCFSIFGQSFDVSSGEGPPPPPPPPSFPSSN